MKKKRQKQPPTRKNSFTRELISLAIEDPARRAKLLEDLKLRQSVTEEVKKMLGGEEDPSGVVVFAENAGAMLESKLLAAGVSRLEAKHFVFMAGQPQSSESDKILTRDLVEEITGKISQHLPLEADTPFRQIFCEIATEGSADSLVKSELQSKIELAEFRELIRIEVKKGVDFALESLREWIKNRR